MNIDPANPLAATVTGAESQLHDLVPFEAGGHLFAVFADQVDGTAEGKVPAPLPHAPNAFLGVVCVRGRMLTVLDPLALVNTDSPSWPAALPVVIALRGDEQLALAADKCRGTITTADGDIQRNDQNTSGGLIIGVIRHGGEEITLLDRNQLFAAAMQRKERRRRRF